MTIIKCPRKLIEVALPLDAINVAAAREKSIRHGHPSTLHLWWARRPLAAARAVLFAQMVNDPGYERHLGRGVNKEKATIERERLFRLIEELVQWENTNNEDVLERARAEIRRSWHEVCELNKNHPQAAELFNPDRLPAFHDPFAGGGAIPLEAQRLGLASYASDLNPVAVTINKAMIEIPPRFAGRAPVGPRVPGERQGKLSEDWRGARGLAEDVRRYGAWMRAAAEKCIGHLYPKIEITADMAAEREDLKPLVGQQLTVIAWLWARTVKSPNPAFSHVDVPLASTFVLSSKPGKEAYVLPVVEGDRYRFVVRTAGSAGFQAAEYERAKSGTKLARGANFRCLLSDAPIEQTHIRGEFKAKRAGERLMAIVAEGTRGRVYLEPTLEHEAIARQAQPKWKPEVAMNQDSKDLLSGRGYGFQSWHELFTQRQLVALTTFSDLVGEAIERCRQDALAAGLPDDGIGLDAGGTGATAYAQAVGVYLAFAISKVANIGSSIASWMNDRGAFRETFARQAIPMVWDFAESNPFADVGGSLDAAINKGAMSVRDLPRDGCGHAQQADAQTQRFSKDKIISTDPPYYDNIGYADLSDFFYVWLRRALRPIYPGLFATVAVPKAEELVATPYRHGGREAAERFFLDGMKKALHNLAEQAHPAFPVTIYYAFKQSETKDDAGTSSTGWETFLEAVLQAGFALTGTWPVRTEGSGRMIASGTNALASSIVLVCRKRPADAPTVSRREFLRELNATLPEALLEMTQGTAGQSPVAPVDLAQAIIGPGMAVFSRYAAVLEADGTPMPVRTALQLINRCLAGQENELFDQDTRFCLDWFEQQRWQAGPYGTADVLARARGAGLGHLQEAGVVASGAGKVRLVPSGELGSDWSPQKGNPPSAWEVLQRLLAAFASGGEQAACRLLARLPAMAEIVRALAYQIYIRCERKGWSDEARACNELVTAWPAIMNCVQSSGPSGTQTDLAI